MKEIGPKGGFPNVPPWVRQWQYCYFIKKNYFICVLILSEQCGRAVARGGVLEHGTVLCGGNENIRARGHLRRLREAREGASTEASCRRSVRPHDRIRTSGVKQKIQEDISIEDQSPAVPSEQV